MKYAGAGSPSPHQLLLEQADDLADVGIDFHTILDEAAGVQDGAVVSAAKGFADGAEGGFREAAGEEHGDLARKSNVLRPALAGHVRQANVEMFGHLLLNLVNV